MPFDPYQKIVLDSYGEHVVETPDDIEECGDTLLKFLLVELSEAEDCTSNEVAIARIDSAISQLQAVKSAFEELVEEQS